MFQSLSGNLRVPAYTLTCLLRKTMPCFNPFQGIWEFRLPSDFSTFVRTGKFQSLSGNLRVPAIARRPASAWHTTCFNPFQGIWEFRLPSDFSTFVRTGKFQSLSGNLRVPASGRNLQTKPWINVSIPFREFESSGILVLSGISEISWCFNPFQGIWEFRPLAIAERAFC